jgi:hypothetical protein
MSILDVIWAARHRYSFPNFVRFVCVPVGSINVVNISVVQHSVSDGRIDLLTVPTLAFITSTLLLYFCRFVPKHSLVLMASSSSYASVQCVLSLMYPSSQSIRLLIVAPCTYIVLYMSISCLCSLQAVYASS